MPTPTSRPAWPDGGPAFPPLVIVTTPHHDLHPADFAAILEEAAAMRGGGLSQRLYLAARFVPTMADILAREGRLEEEKAIRSALNFADTLLRMNERDLFPARAVYSDASLADEIAAALLDGGPTNDACVNADRVVKVLRTLKVIPS